MSQHIPTDTIIKLLRVHSYDVDFKRKAQSGDSLDVFFDVPNGSDDRDGLGEVLYTSMTVDGKPAASIASAAKTASSTIMTSRATARRSS